jgi:hypothetical protein
MYFTVDLPIVYLIILFFSFGIMARDHGLQPVIIELGGEGCKFFEGSECDV